MQFLSAIKKLASLFPRLQNAKWRETSTDSTVIEPNRSNLNIFCIFQEPLSREKYAYVGLYVNYALGKSSYVSKIPPVLAKNKIKTVSVFLSTLQLTALLLKKFRFRLHCYNLMGQMKSGIWDEVSAMVEEGAHTQWLPTYLHYTYFYRTYISTYKPCKDSSCREPRGGNEIV